MARQTYVEELGHITLFDSVVKMDFAAAGTEVDATGRPIMISCRGIAMTLPDFLHSLAEFSKVAETLKEMLAGDAGSAETPPSALSSNFRD